MQKKENVKSNNDNEKQVMDENEWDNNLKETDS